MQSQINITGLFLVTFLWSELGAAENYSELHCKVSVLFCLSQKCSLMELEWLWLTKSTFLVMALSGWQVWCWWFGFGHVTRDGYSHCSVCKICMFYCPISLKNWYIFFFLEVVHTDTLKSQCKGYRSQRMSFHWLQWDLDQV